MLLCLRAMTLGFPNPFYKKLTTRVGIFGAAYKLLKELLPLTASLP